MNVRFNLSGQTFGRWFVLNEHKTKISDSSKSTKVIWKCRCQCGNVKWVQARILRNKRSRSCGCLRNEQRRLSYGQASFNRIYSSYVRGAKKRKLIFQLSKTNFRKLITANCYYCGSVPANKQLSKNHGDYGEFIYNGIDRKDNSQGYIIENCVSCCKICNYMKQELSYYNFLKHIEKICVLHIGAIV